MSGAHILLVEDDPVARAAVAANLAGHGYVALWPCATRSTP